MSDEQNTSTEQPPAGEPKPAEQPDPPKPAAPPAPPEKGADKPAEKSGTDDDGEDWKARARQWEDRSKANKKTADDTAAERDQLAQTLDALRKALDPNGSQDEDPAKVAERAAAERDAKDAELRTLRLERAAEKAARKAGADVDALLDSRGFAAALGKLDPAADDLDSQLEQAVTAALDANPRLKAAPSGPARSSPDPSGTPSASGQLTRADLKGMTPEEITEARRAGRLDSLMRGST